MARIPHALSTLALVASLALASPAAAQSVNAYYHAELAQPTAPDKVISSDVLWYAHANTLEAPATSDLPRQVCATLAHNVGTITTFAAEGKALSADDLTYCNKRARKAK